MVEHPSASSLQRFMNGDGSSAETRAVVRHLLTGCGKCRGIARQFWGVAPVVKDSPEQGTPTPRRLRAEAYAGLFQKVLPKIWHHEKVLNSERSQAADLVKELKDLPQGRRILLSTNSRRFQTWALCALVIDEAFRLGPRDPRLALEMAETATAIADSLDESKYGIALTFDLRARAWAVLGNARRIQSDLEGSAEAFRTARNHLSLGTGDVLEKAKVLDLEATLRAAHRDFGKTHELLDEVIKIYREANEHHLLGCALVAKASHLGEDGENESAVELLKRGLALIDPEIEPRRLLVARHNLVLFLHEAGKHHQALALVPETRALHEALSNRVDLMRFRWLEGKIALGHGDLEGAAWAFSSIQDEFVQLGILNDAALVSLDLAVVYLRQGRLADVQAIAAQVLGIFKALRIPRETLGALVLFQKAAAMERVELGFIQELRAFLVKSAKEPGLQFVPTSR